MHLAVERNQPGRIVPPELHGRTQEPIEHLQRDLALLAAGNLDLPGLVQMLKQIRFGGPTVIEFEGDVENPVPALKACVQAITPLR